MGGRKSKEKHDRCPNSKRFGVVHHFGFCHHGVGQSPVPEKRECHKQRHQTRDFDVFERVGGDSALGHFCDQQTGRSLVSTIQRGPGRFALVGHGGYFAAGGRYDAVLVAPPLAHLIPMAFAPRSPFGRVHEHSHHVPEQFLLLLDDAWPVVCGGLAFLGFWRFGVCGLHRGQVVGDFGRPLRVALGRAPVSNSGLAPRHVGPGADHFHTCHALGTPRHHQCRWRWPLQRQLWQFAVFVGHHFWQCTHHPPLPRASGFGR